MKSSILRRQYKKDTLYVYDLYTLTYDSHETLDSLGEFVSINYILNIYVIVKNICGKIFIKN